jgi:starch phosphorylase
LWVSKNIPMSCAADTAFSHIGEDLIMNSKAAKQRVIPVTEKLTAKYGCGPVHFSGRDEALYERHLLFDSGVDVAAATARDQFEALARSVRDVLSQRWLLTEKTYEEKNPKRLYYLSMEFLIGRSLANNVVNLLLSPLTDQFIQDKKLNLIEILEQEPDAGLGNGGLGRLAACFVESAATLQIPALGYGLRYEYGIFKQTIQNGAQQEMPDNWLRSPTPGRSPPEREGGSELGCSVEFSGGSLRPVPGRPMTLIGIPFDRAVIGYGGSTINTLRLWAAAAHDNFNFEEFSHGDFVEAFTQSLAAETLTRVLYPDDSRVMGQGLRLMQEYFLVACSLADAVRRFQRSNLDWRLFPDKVAIQMNDTHPALAVPEPMRILLDQVHLDWDEAGTSPRTHLHTQITPAARKRSKNGQWSGLKKCCPGSSRSSTKSIAVFWAMSADGFRTTRNGFSA